MNAMSNNWKPEMLSSGKACDGNLYSTSAGSEVEQEELTMHIADKKTRQVGRMVEAMVIMFVAVVVVFALYKVFTSF